MLDRVQNIAFKGVYDLIVPRGTSKDRINCKAAEIEKVVTENVGDELQLIRVHPFDDRIRIISKIDNPYLISNLFNAIGGEALALQYFKRNVQEYNLNIQA